ncbi:MAG: BolA family transcriptional regulator [Proteobacteria bacterium]|nr:BolA family transcriptional regulator [Pseudomonadota bacterium]
MQISIEKITQSIQQHLSDNAVLKVVDESHMHYGHQGHNPAVGVTHVAITIVWKTFEGVNTIERQRMVNTWLAELFRGGLHAVSYMLKTPDETTHS